MRSYFELRGTQNQFAVAHRNVENQRETSETRTATALIAVYKALGGGWELQGQYGMLRTAT